MAVDYSHLELNLLLEIVSKLNSNWLKLEADVMSARLGKNLKNLKKNAQIYKNLLRFVHWLFEGPTFTGTNLSADSPSKRLFDNLQSAYIFLHSFMSSNE